MRRLISVALYLFTGLMATRTALAQCADNTTQVTYIRHVLRTGGNDVESGAGIQIDGDYWYLWQLHASWDEYVGSTLTHQGSAYDSDFDIGLAYQQWDDAPSDLGPGNYELNVSYEMDSDCGYQQVYFSIFSLLVNKPTIGGPPITQQTPYTLYNLGPGTADPISTSNGYQYNQSAILTINTNCGGGDICNDTPSWTINSPASTLNLSTTSGNQTTLRVGPNYGNCAYDTPVSVSIGGFSSDAITFGVNSPQSASSTLSDYEQLNSGYQTTLFYQVTDVCGSDLFTTMPFHENFGSWSFGGNVAGWTPPQAGGANAFQIDDQTFADYIYAYGPWFPSPVYSQNGPQYFTPLMSAHQEWWTGSATPSSQSGKSVYSGTIVFYQDHGDSR